MQAIESKPVPLNLGENTDPIIGEILTGSISAIRRVEYLTLMQKAIRATKEAGEASDARINPILEGLR